MKKLVVMIALILLTGCSNSQSVFTIYEQNKSQETVRGEKEKAVRPEVFIHSPIGSSHGYVVHVEKNKKYIVTVASVVSTHPRALIETSTGQIVEGEIIGVNRDANIAILSTKLTAPIKAYTLSEGKEVASPLQVSEAFVNEEQNELLAMTSIVKEGTSFVQQNVPSPVIKALLTNALENPISYVDRIEFKSFFASYPQIEIDSNNAVQTYEKDTFTYNPDELLLFINEFQKALNHYFETKDESELVSYVASDDLKSTIQQIAESDSGVKQFGSVKLMSSKKEDFQYIVQGKTSLTVDDEVGELSGVFKCIVMNGEWKLISVSYK